MKINIFLSVIWLSVQYKNTSKIKVLQMPWNLNMIFSRIFENIWHWEHNRGVNHLPTRVEGAPCPPRVRPLPRGPIVALLHLSFHPYTSSSSHKHEYPAQTRVQAHFAAIFDLLPQSTSHKLLWGIVPGYVTPPMVQLVFVLVLYSLQIFVA